MKEKLFKIIMSVTVVPGLVAGGAILALSLNDQPQPGPTPPVVVPEDIILDPYIDRLDLEMGQSKQLHAKVLPEGASQTVGWESRDESVVTVDPTGLVETQGVGDTWIIAYPYGYGDSNMKIHLPVHVSPTVRQPAHITLDKTSWTMYMGSSAHQLEAKVFDENWQQIYGYEVDWDTSNIGVASVEGGLINAVGEGQATIYAWPKGRDRWETYATCSVTVYPAREVPTGMTFTPDTPSKELVVGETYTITAAVLPEGIDWSVTWDIPRWASDYIEYYWDHGNKTIHITAKKPGSVTIGAYPEDYYDYKKTCDITVVAPQPTGVIIEPKSLNLSANQTHFLKAIVQPEGATQTVNWSSSDETVVSVGHDGYIEALKSGMATITATVQGYDNVKGTCAIRVVGDDEGDYLWETFEDQETGAIEAIITGYAGAPGDIKIPSTVYDAAGNEYNVTQILNDAFFGRDDITSCEIPSTIKVIGKSAFEYCNNLKSVKIAAKKMGQSIFARCSKLTNIEFTENVEEIGPNAFQNTIIETLDIENSNITTIGTDAFRGCSVLETVKLPASLKNLDDGVFYSCSSLSTITVHEDNESYKSFDSNCIVRTAGGDNTLVFGCKNTTIPENVVKIAQGAFYGCSGLSEIEIPKNVIEIGSVTYPEANQPGVFEGCSISTIEFSDSSSLTTIGNKAFYNSRLTSIVFPDTLQTIGYEAFYYNTGLNSVTFSSNSQLKKIGAEAFYKCSFSKFNMPTSVETISNNAFSSNSQLTSLTIPANVVEIGESILFGCDNVKTIVVKEGNKNYYSLDSNSIIRKSDKTLIQGCSETDISSLSGFVSIIGDYAFQSMTALEEITIPEGVTKIGQRAFSYCKALTTINLKTTQLKEIGICAFSQAKISSISLPDSLEIINNFAFEYTPLTNITIPKNVKQINCYSFLGCESLKSAKILAGPNLEGIQYEAFAMCTALESVEFGEGQNFTLIDRQCFQGCAALKTIIWPKNLTTIGEKCFQGCNSLESVSLPDKVTTIGNNCFNGCTSLASIDLPNSLTSVGYNCFQGCTSLPSIIWPTTQSIPSNCFQGCTALTSITIPNSVTQINYDCFNGCTNLSSVVLPTNINWLDEGAFTNCTSLTTITLPESLSNIRNHAFKGCIALKQIDMTAWKTIPPETWTDSALAGLPGEGNVLFSSSISETQAQEIFDYLLSKGLPLTWTWTQS